MKYSFTFLAAVACQGAHAALQADGPWTNNDWYDATNKIGVANGIPYSNDPATQRRITAPLTFDGDVSQSYLQQTNVQRVKSVFTQADWDAGFAFANSLYSYDVFLQAVAKFPAFCNETNTGQDLDTSCKRELAALFAHIVQETGANAPNWGELWKQGLYWVEEIACAGENGACPGYTTGSGSWATTAWPPVGNKQYYGRGPLQLSWNYNYGMFSNIIRPSSYDAKSYLLADPQQVATNSFYATSAALWFYMTPQDPKPSMHDVMTEFWTPNSVDLSKGITTGFGTTTNIINGGLECGPYNDQTKANKRAQYYTKWLEQLGLAAETNMTCSTQTNFNLYQGGGGDVAGHFDPANCKVANWQTGYSVSARDDYKRCMCALYGNADIYCLPGDADTSNQSSGDPSGGGSSGGDDSGSGGSSGTDDSGSGGSSGTDDSGSGGSSDPSWSTFATLQQIRDTPHYSSTSYSRTLYQMDREMTFIEDKLAELLQVAIDNNLF